MKTLLTCFLLAAARTACAAHFAVITHGQLDTPHVVTGIPTNWPARQQPIVGTNLPAQYPADTGWKVMTGEEVEALKASLKPAFDVWRAARDEAGKPGLVWTRREFIARVTPQEWKAFKRAATTNEIAEMAWDTLMLSTQVEQNAPETIQLLMGLHSSGVIQSTNRVYEILGK